MEELIARILEGLLRPQQTSAGGGGSAPAAPRADPFAFIREMTGASERGLPVEGAIMERTAGQARSLDELSALAALTSAQEIPGVSGPGPDPSAAADEELQRRIQQNIIRSGGTALPTSTIPREHTFESTGPLRERSPATGRPRGELQSRSQIAARDRGPIANELANVIGGARAGLEGSLIPGLERLIPDVQVDPDRLTPLFGLSLIGSAFAEPGPGEFGSILKGIRAGGTQLVNSVIGGSAEFQQLLGRLGPDELGALEKTAERTIAMSGEHDLGASATRLAAMNIRLRASAHRLIRQAEEMEDTFGAVTPESRQLHQLAQDQLDEAEEVWTRLARAQQIGRADPRSIADPGIFRGIGQESRNRLPPSEMTFPAFGVEDLRDLAERNPGALVGAVSEGSSAIDQVVLNAPTHELSDLAFSMSESIVRQGEQLSPARRAALQAIRSRASLELQNRAAAGDPGARSMLSHFAGDEAGNVEKIFAAMSDLRPPSSGAVSDLATDTEINEAILRFILGGS